MGRRKSFGGIRPGGLFRPTGLHLESRNQQTNKPTAERVLKAFDKISLTIIQEAAGNEIRRWLTPLSAVQQDILYRL